MRARALILLLVAVVLAGGTALLARSWLASQREREIQEAAPVALQKPARSVLVAHANVSRGQILRPDDLVWQIWPEGALDKNYVVMGGQKKPDSYSGWVAVNPIAEGEPVTEAKIIAPGNRGFLAAVLRPGMRAVSVPVTVTSGISGFIFPGDQVDILLTYGIPKPASVAAQGSSGQAYEHKAAETVLRDVRVIAIDQRLQSKAGEAVVAHTATFEVTPKQSEIIALANEVGKLSLSLRSLVPDNGAQDAAAEVTPAALQEAAAQAAGPTLAQATPAVANQPAAHPTAAAVPIPAQNLAAPAQSATPAAATAATGGPHLVTPGTETAGKNATYTVDSEISTLLPQMQGGEQQSVLYECKGPALFCISKEEQAQIIRDAAAAYGAERARTGR